MEESLKKLLKEIKERDAKRTNNINEIIASIKMLQQREDNEIERFGEGIDRDRASGLYMNITDGQFDKLKDEEIAKIKQRYKTERENLDNQIKEISANGEKGLQQDYMQISEAIKKYHVDMTLEVAKAKSELNKINAQKEQQLQDIDKSISEKEAKYTHLIMQNRKFMDISLTQVSGDITALQQEIERLKMQKQSLSEELDSKHNTLVQYLQDCENKKARASLFLGKIKLSDKSIDDIYEILFEKEVEQNDSQEIETEPVVEESTNQLEPEVEEEPEITDESKVEEEPETTDESKVVEEEPEITEEPEVVEVIQPQVKEEVQETIIESKGEGKQEEDKKGMPDLIILPGMIKEPGRTVEEEIIKPQKPVPEAPIIEPKQQPTGNINPGIQQTGIRADRKMKENGQSMSPVAREEVFRFQNTPKKQEENKKFYYEFSKKGINYNGTLLDAKDLLYWYDDNVEAIESIISASLTGAKKTEQFMDSADKLIYTSIIYSGKAIKSNGEIQLTGPVIERLREYYKIWANPKSQKETNMKIKYNLKGLTRQFWDEDLSYDLYQMKQNAFGLRNRKDVSVNTGLFTMLEFRIRDWFEQRKERKQLGGKTESSGETRSKEPSVRERVKAIVEPTRSGEEKTYTRSAVNRDKGR